MGADAIADALNSTRVEPEGAPAPDPDERAELARRLLAREVELEPLTPEASARRYFRPARLDLRGWLVVRSPDPAPVDATEWLHGRGVRAPRVVPLRRDAYLVEDCGDRHLADAPELERYVSVLTVWRRFAARPLPPEHPQAALALDEPLFRRELGMFLEQHLFGWHERSAGSEQRAARASTRPAAIAACASLAAAAARGPWTPQHRDFHSRNLLLPDDGEAVWIDHQDLRPGPLFYDLASLRTDAYLDLPPGVVGLLEAAVPEFGASHGLDPEASRQQFRATALQRVLKALGTFGRLLRLGRRDYEEAEVRARRLARALLTDSGPDADVLLELLS